MMNDRELQRRLQGWYERAASSQEPAPAELRQRVAAIPSTTPPGRLTGRGRLALLAVAAVMLIGGAVAGAGVVRLATDVQPSPPTALLATTEPSPSPALTASAATPVPSPSLGLGFSWTGADTSIVRGQHSATLLADGRVLVIQDCELTGGPADPGGPSEIVAELYDPAKGLFSPTGSLSVGRAAYSTTLLPDGRVLVAGGGDCATATDNGTWASAEIYDPATGEFTTTGPMTAPRQGHTATLLQDGRVLITGGFTGPQPGAARAVTLASIRLADTCRSTFLDSAEIYDPATGRFTAIRSMGTLRGGHTATMLNDGRVLLLGGACAVDNPPPQIYDPASGGFTATGSMKASRSGFTATRLLDGSVLIVGGGATSGDRSAEIYDPRSGTFHTAGLMLESRDVQTATLLADGRVFVAGGTSWDGFQWQPLSSTELYDPAATTFAEAGSMGTPRSGHTATLLNDGRVLITGGGGSVSREPVELTSSVLYQP
jgi:hypothetical protein